MKTLRLTVFAACLAALFTGSSYACGFHEGFGGGAYGMSWQPYDPGNEYDSYNDAASDDSDSKTTEKARPVFSSSALRSSDSAKAKLAERKADENSVDQNGDDE